MLLLRAANERAIRMCRQLGLNQLRIEKNRPGPVMINFINSICVGLLKFQDSPQSFPVQDAMDNLTKKDQPDRSKINMHEAYVRQCKRRRDVGGRAVSAVSECSRFGSAQRDRASAVPIGFCLPAFREAYRRDRCRSSGLTPLIWNECSLLYLTSQLRDLSK